LARNTGNKRTKISGKITYTNENDEVVSINIPKRNIAPNSTKTINLHRIIKIANVPESVKIAGIEMKYSTRKGSVLMNLITKSQSGNHVFQTPMLSIARPHAS